MVSYGHTDTQKKNANANDNITQFYIVIGHCISFFLLVWILHRERTHYIYLVCFDVARTLYIIWFV